MIIKIRQWCEGIIIAVIISIIIEMIIPEGKNKKYIKVIIGVYIMFVSLTPILELLDYDFNFNKDYLTGFKLLSTKEFKGNSHEKITKDVYVK